MKPLTPPIKWHGGKHYQADWIISHMPPHTHYVEAYCGGNAVMLRKDPNGVSEVANDINFELTNFWCALQDEDCFTQFKRRVEAIPFSQVEWESSGRDNPITFDKNGGMLGRAVNFFIRARQSRQGLMKDFATLSRTRTRRGMNEQVSSWLTAIEGLPDVHERLKRVAILNRPAIEVIRQQDGPNTLFYLDPPYMHETRQTTSDYAHEMTERDHRELLGVLEGIKGKFLLSGYESRLYASAELHNGWFRISRDIDNKASSKKTKDIKTECLWANYDLEAVRGAA